MNLPATCATCHAENERKFRLSAHGLAVSKGDTAAPACATCHGEHPKPASPGAATGAPVDRVGSQACSRCHGPVLLLAQYGIASDQFKSFADSYHGLAVRDRSVEVANCASCHDAHDIKPPNDPASGVNKANRPATCGKCHRRGSDRLSSGPVHAKTTAPENNTAPSRILRNGIILAAVLAGGMILYGRRRRARPAPPGGAG